jgi:hypothetical protein
MRHIACPLVVTTALLVSSCDGSQELVALRLVDLFEAATVEGTVSVDPVEPTEWRFDGAGTIPLPEPPEEDEDDDEGEDNEQQDRPDLAPTFGWAALNDIEGLEVIDGRLVGTAGELPVLHVVRPEDLLDENDLLHAVEITMQVSAGTEIGITFNGGRQLNEERTLRNIRNAPEPPLHTELEPGAEFHTYRLENPGRSFTVGGLRNILIEPTDAADATFADHCLGSGLAGTRRDLSRDDREPRSRTGDARPHVAGTALAGAGGGHGRGPPRDVQRGDRHRVG